eukprot:TRINITY_DN37498_c0_g2_i2.p1 TRINITY_DN37498_c0_g2~~TRINITY_DN37498_c0_g2_i2.p1  ORF type:complete len:395 (+),score=83.11 TRINITY_DN37498_c0_g2_i2:24-1187(+)
MPESAPFAFELHGFRDCRLDGIYRVQEEEVWNTRSGSNMYKTYWKIESERPYFMYWQENKGRHAITPQFDNARADLLHGNLFPQVQNGVEEPGLAFYRPMPNNEWLEYDFDSRRWVSHPQERNIYYAPLTWLQLQQRLRQLQAASFQPAVASSYNPSSPVGVPAACTPVAFAMPGTPVAAMPGTPRGMLATTCAPSTPVVSFAMPGTPRQAMPGTPRQVFGAAPGTPQGAAPSTPIGVLLSEDFGHSYRRQTVEAARHAPDVPAAAPCQVAAAGAAGCSRMPDVRAELNDASSSESCSSSELRRRSLSFASVCSARKEAARAEKRGEEEKEATQEAAKRAKSQARMRNLPGRGGKTLDVRPLRSCLSLRDMCQRVGRQELSNLSLRD